MQNLIDQRVKMIFLGMERLGTIIGVWQDFIWVLWDSSTEPVTQILSQLTFLPESDIVSVVSRPYPE